MSELEIIALIWIVVAIGGCLTACYILWSDTFDD